MFSLPSSSIEILALFLFIAIRISISSLLISSISVDHYYWLLAAKAYKIQSSLPVTLKGKYLLESTYQYYPPLFGKLISYLPLSLLDSPKSGLLPSVFDILTSFLLYWALKTQSLNSFSIIVGLFLLLFNPLSVVYNIQLTSRSLGNFFLTIFFVNYINIYTVNQSLPYTAFLIVIASFSLAALFLSHKMSYQFFVLTSPLLSIAFGKSSTVPPLITLMTIVILSFVILFTFAGTDFINLQLKAHIEILSFWRRNWKWLGSHQFRDSPNYAFYYKITENLQHPIYNFQSTLLRLFSYSPMLFTVVLLALIPGQGIPSLYMIWSILSILVAVFTLFLPQLRFLGSGLYYTYCGAFPSALCWAFATYYNQSSNIVLFLAILTLILSILSISFAIQLRLSKHKNSLESDDSMHVIKYLNSIDRTLNVAAFPMTLSEPIAYLTKHRVFWGGHGLGFSLLDEYWPIFKAPFSKMILDYKINIAIFNLQWLALGDQSFFSDFSTYTSFRIGSFLIFENKKHEDSIFPN
jgi:hypothetical protein